MNTLLQTYKDLNKSVCTSFKSCGYVLRAKASAGLWLIPLLPVSLLVSSWKHSDENSNHVPVSSSFFSTMVVSFGLLLSTILYIMRFFPKAGSWLRDFNAIFVFPAIGTLIILLQSQNSFVLSLVGGLLSSYGILAGLPSLLTIAPGCFTIGEAVVIVHAIVLFIFSSVINFSHIALSHSSATEDNVVSYETATFVLQTGSLGMLVVISSVIAFPSLRQPKQFYCLFGIFVAATLGIPKLMLNVCPLLWILHLFTRDLISLAVLFYWIGCSLMAVVAIWHQSVTAQKASTSQRKVFHVLAVAVFSVGLLYAPDILYLASVVTLAVFALLETVRILNIPPVADYLQSGFNVFVDEKDAAAALTPLYLLAGVAIPFWISPVNDIPIPKSKLLPFFSGILSVGVGDSVASYIGSRFGRLKWPGSNRTIEGSIACFLSQLFAVAAMIHLGVLSESVSYLRTTFALIAVTLVEAQTDQVDNLVLPLILYTLTV